MAETRTLTIESNYCENWTIQDAIREIIQNGLDTGTEVTFLHHLEQNGTVWEVRDNGAGMKLSDFIIGRSSKRDNKSVIGQFGEGLKIGCLVLAREGRQVSIISLGKRYDFSIKYDEAWQERLLTIDIEDSPPTTGTSVCIECSEEELRKARSLFMQLNPQVILETIGRGSEVAGSEILDSPGCIYVNGLAVTKIEALYGYNFVNRKELVNRDRSVIGRSQINNCIAEALSYTTNMAIITTLLTRAIIKADGSTPAELNVQFYPHRNIWLKAIRELCGRKVCLTSHSPVVDMEAMERGWTVLTLPWSFHCSLQNILPLADTVSKDTNRIVPFSRLTAEQKEFFNKGKRVADEIAGEAGLTPYPVKIFVDKEKKDEARLFNFGSQTGYYLDGIAGVCYPTIKEKDLGKFVGTLMHEYTHGNGGHADHTRAFENDLTDVIASLGLALIMEREKAKRIGLNYGLKRSGNEA